MDMVRVMVCNVTFNNISVISWQSVLVVQKRNNYCLNDFAFKCFGIELTRWRLFQKGVVCPNLDIYVFVCIFWLFDIKRNLSLDT
jgi:hypothetical protein